MPNSFGGGAVPYMAVPYMAVPLYDSGRAVLLAVLTVVLAMPMVIDTAMGGMDTVAMVIWL